VQAGGAGVHVFVLDAGDRLAAAGHGGAGPDAFVYDRIVTQADLQRKGLGRAVMATLEALRPDPETPQLLVATEAGRALYATLGWHVVAPYASARWVGDSPVQN
jgi:GNAT superfamily N-acetyltransferase